MRRSEHMKRHDVDAVIGNNRILCFDGFDNAAASTLDILDTPDENRNSHKCSEVQYEIVHGKRCATCQSSRHREDEAAAEGEVPNSTNGQADELAKLVNRSRQRPTWLNGWMKIEKKGNLQC